MFRNEIFNLLTKFRAQWKKVRRKFDEASMWLQIVKGDDESCHEFGDTKKKKITKVSSKSICMECCCSSSSNSNDLFSTSKNLVSRSRNVWPNNAMKWKFKSYKAVFHIYVPISFNYFLHNGRNKGNKRGSRSSFLNVLTNFKHIHLR